MQAHNYKQQSPNPLNQKIESSRVICSFKELLSLQPTQIAIYGGSFDPPQMAHLASIRKLAEQNQIVVVMPLGKNPYKPGQPYASDLNRLEMLDVMLAGLNNVFICTEEIQRANRTGGTTRTIDTLQLARSELPDTKLRLVVGADCLQKIHLWNHFQRIFELADPLVFKRPGYESENWQGLVDNLGWELVRRMRAGVLDNGLPEDLASVSSTEVRQAVKDGTAVLNRLLDPEVLNYIKAQGLYL